MTPQDVLKLVDDKGVEFVDLRFLDFPGLWQHLTVPVRELTLDSFTDGFGFDGSSLRGWQAINESDMVIVPVPKTAIIDPFCQHTTLSMICDIQDPLTRQRYSRDPRSVARKAADYMRSTGIADTAYFGPELEFFIFDQVCYDQGMNYAHYRVDSREGSWRRGEDEPDNLGNQLRPKEGYFPCPPADTMHNLRSEMVTVLEQCGIRVETHHHEVATGGQAEIDMRFDRLVEMGDKVMLYKYILKNVAARHGKVVTFMPKPLYEDNGSGMHTHFSLWKGDTPLFFGDKYAELSDTALWAIGGLVRHAGAVLAFTNPTTSSYKRLVPGYEAPVNLIYSMQNRTAFVRIPMYHHDPRTKRIEFRCPDSSCNPYLALSAIMMAALDGIENRIDPGPPVDENLYSLPAERLADIGQTPASLEGALQELGKDHEFLLKGGVFTEDVIRYWIKYKMENEVAALRSRPHPYEFCLYFDI
ncbi:MAG: type I glutamate--ammonia ligase [Planctomycetes bacterium]|nr:type I glutamate--ammonia ligase [Planctomycetota bacterium]